MSGILLAVLAAVGASACSDERCPKVGSHCDGTQLIACDEDEWSDHYVTSIDDCVRRGQICVENESGNVAACVDDVPCTADACAGTTILSCVGGVVFHHFDCADGASGRTCVIGAAGPTCGYQP